MFLSIGINIGFGLNTTSLAATRGSLVGILDNSGNLIKDDSGDIIVDDSGN